MSVIKGTVQSCKRDGTGIKVQDQWYNGTKQLLAGVNWKDTISMVVDGKNIVSVDAANAEPAATKSFTKRSGGFDDTKRQGVIVYQSSRKDAIEVATAVLQAGVLPLPTAKGDKFDAFMAFVDELTDKFHGEAMSVFETGELPERGGE